MKILVVEGEVSNIRIALQQLSNDHDYLSVALNATDAMNILRESTPTKPGDGAQAEGVTEKEASQYDVVLANVVFPPRGETPVGPILALLALRLGVKKVGLLYSGYSIGDHSDDLIYKTLEYLGTFTLGEVKVVVDITQGDAKDWKKVLDQLV